VFVLEMSDSYVYLMLFSPKNPYKMCYHGNHTWISYRKYQRRIGYYFSNSRGNQVLLQQGKKS